MLRIYLGRLLTTHDARLPEVLMELYEALEEDFRRRTSR